MNDALLQDATPLTLQHAAAQNHRDWFNATAHTLNGEVHEAEGVTWTSTPNSDDSMIAFPTLASDRADTQLDEIIATYLTTHSAPGAPLVGCWSLDPPTPADLGLRLLARGFQPGWQPCWMALDLQALDDKHTKPAQLTIEANNTVAVPEAVPYAGSNNELFYAQLEKLYPGRVQRYVARLDNRIVGHSTVWLSEGPLGVAGIYSVGVVPDVRNQGIGKAVVLAACRFAAEHHHRYVLLNATGRRMYEQVGFQWIGDGLTWWLNVPRLAANPPTIVQVALAEGIGHGDLVALDGLVAELAPDTLRQPLTNGMSWMELAVTFKQPTAAEWLMAHGATLNLLSAWDLGWHQRAARMLETQPALVNQVYGEGRTSLLHIAAERGDAELAQLALTAHPDLELKDAFAGSTPLGWARYFGRLEIIQLIEAYAAAHL